MSMEHQIEKQREVFSRYGENHAVTGDYDKTLAVKCRNGTFVGKRQDSVLCFKGVPFAKPPVAELRWKAPQPIEDGEGVFEAYYNGKTPIQTEWETEMASYYPQGEDCLYLNIWVNENDKTARKPVMVFLHGGSYGWGGTADPLYDGLNFVKKQSDIVLVSVGYRVGLMGFVDFSSVEGGEAFPDAPNLGLLDQIEALRWVQKNISGFGGDPDNVTIFGESAGGGSVSLLPMIPSAKGLFRRVIAESGSVALTFSKEECATFTERLLQETKASSMQELMNLSEQELMLANEKLNEINNFPQRDGKLIPLDPYLPYEKGDTADIDIMIGTNANEMNYWIGEVGGIVPYCLTVPVKFENDMKVLTPVEKGCTKLFMNDLCGLSVWKQTEFYNETMFRLPAIRQAELHAKNGGRAYMYYWTVPSVLPLRGACHAVELAYVFGNLDETIYTGRRADEGLSDTVMQLWTNFARTGIPSTERLEWRPYDEKRRLTMVFSEKPYMDKDILRRQRRLLSPLLRRMINPSYAMVNWNVPFTRKIAAASAVAVVALSAAIIRRFRHG